MMIQTRFRGRGNLDLVRIMKFKWEKHPLERGLVHKNLDPPGVKKQNTFSFVSTRLGEKIIQNFKAPIKKSTDKQNRSY